jgi:hypothetical protein
MRLRVLAVVAATISAIACTDGLGPFGGVSLEGANAVFVIEHDDFSVGGTRPEETPGSPFAVGSFLLQASIVPEDTSSATPPMNLWFTVTARNSADTAAVLGVNGCTVWPQLYDSPARDAAPAWVPQGQCAQAPYAESIAPNGTKVFTFLAHSAMLGSALADGRYYASVQFRMAGQTVVLAAGHADVQLREPGLSFHVRVDEDGRAARASVVATNLNSTPTHLEFGACALSLALYRDADRTDLASSWHWADLCLAYLAIASLAPGDSLAPEEFSAEFDNSDVGRDQPVGAGRYYLGVDLSVNWRTYTFPAGVIYVW